MRKIVVLVAALLAISTFVTSGFTVYGDKADRGDLTASIERVRIALSALVMSGSTVYGDKTDRSYITAPIKWASIDKVVKATGTVNPIVMVEVGSELSGKVSQVLVTFNDPVQAGQVIARIDRERYIAGVTGAKADLKIARANAQLQKAALEKAKVTKDENERNFLRNAQLAKTMAIPDRELTQSRALRETSNAELSMAEASLASAESVVEQKEASLRQAEVDLERTEIRAPIDGVVINRTINPGQTVAVSLESKTLFKIADDLREMQVEGKIDEADVGQVKEGQRVTFTVDAYPDKIFSGRVLQVRKSPEVSQSVVTYTGVVSAPNPDHLLFPGMTARLHIIVEETKALKIPDAALRFRPNADVSRGKQSASFGKGSATVWIVDTVGNASPVPVKIGKSDESGAQLLSGNLSDGDRVIVGRAETPVF
jgi:HlyD family secretion protein